MNIRRGDTVRVMTGKDRGKQGVVEKILRHSDQVIITGLNIMKRHIKPNRQYPSGGIIEIAYPIHQSNIVVIEGETQSGPSQMELAERN